MTNQEQNSCHTRSVSTSELIAKIQEQKEKSCDTRKVNPLELVRKEEKQEQESTSEAIKQKLLELKKSIEYNKLLEGSALGLTAYQKPASGIPFSDLSSDTQDRFSKLYQLVQEIKVVSDSNVSSEEKQRWNQKQDKILDLEKIRMGASFGLTSLQSQVQSDWTETDETSAAFIKNKPDLPDTISSEQKITLKFDVDDEEIPIFKDESNNVFDHTEIKEMFDDNTKNVELLYSRHFYSLIRHSGSKYEFASYDISGNVLYLEFTFSNDAFSVYENSRVVDFMKYASTKSPKMDGNATVGISNYYSREDHIHPSDTSRVPITRKINNKLLSSDITLTANDVGALPSTTVIPDAQIQADWEQGDSSKKDYIKNKPTLFSGDYNDLINKPPAVEIPEFNVDRTPTENSTNLVESGGVYDAIDIKVNKPINTIYVTKEYWQTAKENTFSQDNTHYILVEDLYSLGNDRHERAFGTNCVFSAHKECRLGFGKVILNDTYIDAGQQHIFRGSAYYSYGGQVNGTSLEGSFANGRVLPEWWGAKGGRGVCINGSYDNAASEALAQANADAFNDAIYYAGNSEVYAPAPVYLIGKTIYDRNYNLSQTLTSNISLDTDKRPRSYIKLYVEGSLIASNEFIGHYCTCGNAFIEFPSIIYLNGNSPRCIVKGALVVPFSAQDKSIVIGNVPDTLTDSHIGNLYFSYNSTTEMYDVWNIYYHYTSDTDDTKVVSKRQIGRFLTTSSNLQNYRSSTYLYGGQYHNKDSNNGFKVSGMYGISISSVGGYIEIGRILKGDTRVGFWNIAKGRKLMSYKYRTKVMHQGECTAVSLRCVKASTIKIGFIEGFNDGVAFDPTFSPDYDAIEFNRFEISSIACNYAIHALTGAAYACLLNKDKSTQKYFDSCRWILGGFEPLGAGNHGLHSFCPTTSRSTYFLIENNAGRGDGFSCHWAEFNTAPLRWYTCIADIARGSDNQIIMHGNTSGDTGRVVLWTTRAGILSYSKWQVRMNIKDDQGNVIEENILHYKFPSQFNGGNQYIDYRDNEKINNCFQLADGESVSQAMFPIDTFAGMESLYNSFNSTHPYAYSHIAAMTVSNGTNIWQTSGGYPIGSTLAPYLNSVLQYNEWSYPYSDSRKYINFRGGSFKNIIRSGRRHVLCYESVYCDSTSGLNEIHYAQSAYAMFEDNQGGNAKGHWTVFNAFHPMYNVVRYEYFNDPRTYTEVTSYHVTTAKDDTTVYPRTMFVPDENTRACMHVIDSVQDITDIGLYVILGTKEIGYSGSLEKVDTDDPQVKRYVGTGTYNTPRYQLWEKYKKGSTTVTRQVGWISEAFIPRHIKTIKGQSLIGDGNINLNESFNLPGSNQTVGLVVFGKFENEEFYSGVYDEESSPQWEFSETPYTRLINTLYVDITNNKLYRYNGTQYVEASSDRGISVNQEILNIENY